LNSDVLKGPGPRARLTSESRFAQIIIRCQLLGPAPPPHSGGKGRGCPMSPRSAPALVCQDLAQGVLRREGSRRQGRGARDRCGAAAAGVVLVRTSPPRRQSRASRPRAPPASVPAQWRGTSRGSRPIAGLDAGAARYRLAPPPVVRLQPEGYLEISILPGSAAAPRLNFSGRGRLVRLAPNARQGAARYARAPGTRARCAPWAAFGQFDEDPGTFGLRPAARATCIARLCVPLPAPERSDPPTTRQGSSGLTGQSTF
jgi:hypothetical protein